MPTSEQPSTAIEAILAITVVQSIHSRQPQLRSRRPFK